MKVYNAGHVCPLSINRFIMGALNSSTELVLELQISPLDSQVINHKVVWAHVRDIVLRSWWSNDCLP